MTNYGPRHTIEDAFGNPLSIGDRVERSFKSGRTGGMEGEVRDTSSFNCVWVRWIWRGGGGLSSFPLRRRFTLRRSYTCPDLRKLDETQPESPQQEEAAPQAASDRSSA